MNSSPRATPAAVVLFAVAAFCFAPGSAFAADAAPAADKPKSYTWHDYLKEQLAINRETTVDAYKRIGKHGPWDDAAVKFLDRTAYALTYGGARPLYQPPDVPTPAELVALGKAAIDAGCDDPLVRFYYGDAIHDAGGPWQQAYDLVRPAAPALDAAGYPSLCVWGAAVRHLGFDPSNQNRAAMKPLLDKHGVAMASGKLDDGRRRLTYEWLWWYYNGQPAKAAADFVALLRARPDADPWLADAIEGATYVNRAWELRGSGWGATVTAQGWKGFFDNLGQAREKLVAAHKLAPQLPEPAVEMIKVAMGAGDQLGETPMQWFERATAAQIDNRAAYDAIFSALKPRWGGSFEDMYDVGLIAVKTDRYDTEGPWQLFRAVDTIGIDTEQRWADLERPGVYEALCELIDRYAAAHAKDGKDARYVSYRAALAWRKKQYPEARRYLDKVGDRLQYDVFRGMAANDPALTVGAIYAVTSPAADAVKQANAAANAGQLDDAVAAFRNAAQTPDLPPHAKRYVDARIAEIERQQRINRGEWIDLQPTASSWPGWMLRAGHWRLDTDGSLIGTSTADKAAFLLRLESFGPRVEIAGVANGIGENGGNFGPSFGTGPVYGINARLQCGGIYLFGMPFVKETIPVAQGLEDMSRPIEWSARLDNGKLAVTVAGREALRDFAVAPQVSAQPSVGVHVGSGGTARFSKLRARKIVDDAPKP